MHVMSQVTTAMMVTMLLVSGCKSGNQEEPGEAEQGGLQGTRWVLAALGEQQVQAADEKELPYLIFGEEGVSGSTGVNFLSGTYERDGDSLKFGPLITTKRAGTPELMQQETQFTGAIERTAGWRVRDGELELLDADGNVAARFRPGGAVTQ